MNKTEFIDAMLAAGMTPQDIFDLAQARTENKKFEVARDNFMKALEEYIQVIAPDIEFDKEGIDRTKKELIDFEKWLTGVCKTHANKRSDDEIIKQFLDSLGI